MTPSVSVLRREVDPHEQMIDLRVAIDERAGAAHVRNTRGLGLANCFSAFESFVQGALNV